MSEHKVHIYIYRVPQCMSPRRNWDSHTHSLARECTPPPGRGKGVAHSPAGEGLGESQFRRLEKKLSTLSTLHLSEQCDYFLVYLYLNPNTVVPAGEIVQS
jgi:hypothetical protein